MVDLLTDIHLADGYANTLAADTQLKPGVLYRSAFKKHQTDSVQFRKSLAYYSNRPEELGEIYDSVTLRLENLQRAEQKRLDQENKRKEKARRDSLRRDSLKKVKEKNKNRPDSLKNKSKKELQEQFKKKKRM